MTPRPGPPSSEVDVVLLGFDPAFHDPAGRSVIQRLQEAFGIDVNMARHFVDNAPVTVKQRATPEVAQRYERLLLSIGAHVDLRAPGDAGLARGAGGSSPSRPDWGSTPSTVGMTARSGAAIPAPAPAAPPQAAPSPPPEFTPAFAPAPPRPAAAADPFGGKSALEYDGEIRLADEDEPPPRPAAPPASSSPHLTRCPRCSFEQPLGAEECARCGVIFAKAQGSQLGLPTLERPPAVPRPVNPIAPAAIAITPVMPVREAYVEAGPGFWASIPRAFLVPFWGKGLLWQVVLLGVLLAVGCVASIPSCFAVMFAFGGLFLFLGLVGRYFQASAQRGLDGEVEAPALPFGGDFGDFKGDLILPGAIYGLLAIVLMSVPIAATVSSARSTLEAQAPLQGTWKEVKDGELVGSTDAPVLVDSRGEVINLENASGVFDAKDTHEQKVRVVVERKHIIAYNDAGVATDAPLDMEEPPLVPPMILLTFLIPLIFWPMCVTVGLIDGSMASMFNPIKVLLAVFKGGLPYLTVVVMGVVATFGCSFAGQLIAAGGAQTGTLGTLGGGLLGAIVGLCSYSYATGVQAWLMGRLAATRPEVFSHLQG